MISMGYKEFLLYLLEDLKGLPGKDAGYVDYKNIDGNHVHIIHKHLGKGKYSSSVQVNGEHIQTQHIPYGTKSKIVAFIKHSANEFESTINPKKITVKPVGGDKKRQQVAQAWGGSRGADVKTGARVTLKFENKKTEHKPSGVVKRNLKDPAYHFTRAHGKINKHLGVAAFVTGMTK